MSETLAVSIARMLSVPSHFSTIGIRVETEDEFKSLANQMASQARSIDVPEGRYLHWSSPSGAEVWIQLDNNHHLIGMTPHFAGKSQLRAGITARLNRPEDTALDGAFHAWADPADTDPTSGLYQFVFDSPDFCRHATLALPSVVQVQLAAFAHEIAIFDSVNACNSTQTDEPQVASRSFIPSGFFAPHAGSTELPQAHASLSGHILQADRLINDLSGHSFYWALVDSLGGLFDVVIDPKLVEDVPKPNGVMKGSFWLSGCPVIVDENSVIDS